MKNMKVLLQLRRAAWIETTFSDESRISGTADGIDASRSFRAPKISSTPKARGTIDQLISRQSLARKA
jgi:hypothetical protein